MIRTLPVLLLAFTATAQIDWGAVASVALPTGEVASVAVGGTNVWTRPNPLPYDAEVDYIEATGTQYIDVGLPTGPDTRTETDLMVTDWDRTTYSLTGSSWNRHTFGKGWSGASTSTGNSGRLYFGLGAQNYASTTTLTSVKGVRHVYWIDATTATAGFDSTSYALTSAGTISVNSFDTLLLAQRTGTGATNVRGQMAARLYGYRQYESGVLVRDMHPVVKAGVGYMHDKVSGTLFGNAGTGSFILGPDK